MFWIVRLTLTVWHSAEGHGKVCTPIQVIQGSRVTTQKGSLTKTKMKLLLLACRHREPIFSKSKANYKNISLYVHTGEYFLV
jgi:hypothetical protein